jgi:rhodanese-related sulfurtransferase
MATEQNPYHISAKTFAKLYKNREWDPNQIEIIDVREPEEWERYHLKNTKLISMGTIPERVEELDPGKKIYVMCAHGIRSLHVVNFLRMSSTWMAAWRK